MSCTSLSYDFCQDNFRARHKVFNHSHGFCLLQANFFDMKYFLALSLICTVCLTTMAQDKIILQHQKRERKQKVLSLDKSYQYKLNDSTYHYGKIQSFDIGQITIMKYDSVLVSMKIDEIELITRVKSQNTKWLEPFGYIAFGAAMTVGAIPMLWLIEGGATALGALEFAGILTAVSAPPLLIGWRQERYNLKKRWRIEVRLEP